MLRWSISLLDSTTFHNICLIRVLLYSEMYTKVFRRCYSLLANTSVFIPVSPWWTTTAPLVYFYIKQRSFLTSWLQLSTWCSSCFKRGNRRTLLMNQLKVTPHLSLKFSHLVMKRGTSLFLLLCILLPSCGYFFSFTSRFNIKYLDLHLMQIVGSTLCFQISIKLVSNKYTP